MDETIKPCPFCGGVAGVDKTNYYFEDSGELAMSAWVVSCRVCGMRTEQYRSEEGAVAVWNRRAERTGRYVYDEGLCGWVCSECGGLEPVGDHVRYCPDCGARVVGE